MAALTEITDAMFNESLETFRPQSQSLVFFTEREKRALVAAFMDLVTPTLEAELSRVQAFSAFLLLLADHGGAQTFDSDVAIEVISQGVGQEQPNVLYTESANTIIDVIGQAVGARYTNLRCLRTFAARTSRLLKIRGVQTAYGQKNYIPKRFIGFDFPGAEYLPETPEEARTALSVAKNTALARVRDEEATVAYAARERYGSAEHVFD